MADKVTTTIFRSNRTQPARLPKAVVFSRKVKEVEVLAIGSSCGRIRTSQNVTKAPTDRGYSIR